MFRPCIDLHEGKVKQIVGGTLAQPRERLQTNFVSEHSAAWYAQLYRRDELKGGHVIMLGPGNEAEARAALGAYPGGLQIGGGITAQNARSWLDAGASHVIVTSWVFRDGKLDDEKLGELVRTIGKDKLVLDLSCRWKPLTPSLSSAPSREEGVRRTSEEAAGERHTSGDYFVVTDRWQKFTNLAVSKKTLERLARSCAEFLVHAVDVEGLCRGIDQELVRRLTEWSPIPTTYAGGAKSLADLEEVTRVGQGRIDLTIGSALDIFGGNGVRYEDVIAFNKKLRKVKP